MCLIGTWVGIFPHLSLRISERRWLEAVAVQASRRKRQPQRAALPSSFAQLIVESNWITSFLRNTDIPQPPLDIRETHLPPPTLLLPQHPCSTRPSPLQSRLVQHSCSGVCYGAMAGQQAGTRILILTGDFEINSTTERDRKGQTDDLDNQFSTLREPRLMMRVKDNDLAKTSQFILDDVLPPTNNRDQQGQRTLISGYSTLLSSLPCACNWMKGILRSLTSITPADESLIQHHKWL